jgi:Tol biopolymer transport system component
MRRWWFVLAVAGTVVLPSVVLVAPAGATFPGENGRIVYVERVPAQIEGFTGGEIYTMNPDGSDVQRLTHDAGRWIDRPGASDTVVSSNWGPRWSPDGLFIAYIHRDEWENYSIRLMDADGTFIRTVTDGFHLIWSLSWSPDGKYLIVEGSAPLEGAESGLWVVTEAGEHQTLLVASRYGHNELSAHEPDWSPNGNQIAFSGWYTTSQNVHTINTDGSNLQSFYEGPIWVRQPRWDPSGSLIYLTLFDARSVQEAELMTLDPVTGVYDYLPNTAPGQHTPLPSPDGSDLYFLSEYDNGLWSRNNGRITDMTGSDIDWQPIQRIAHSVGLVDPNTGKWYITSLHGMVYSFYYGNPGDFPIVGDWDCDGDATPGMYRQSDGFVYLRNSNTQGAADIRFFFGNPGDIPIVGDFNGNGCDTVSIYRPSEGRAFIINQLGKNNGGLGVAEFSYFFGNPGDKPFVGDFDGNGIETIGLHRESTGFVYFRNSHTQGVADNEFFFGDPGDRLVADDWNGDGSDSPGVYRPSDRTFYLRYTNTQGNADEHFTWGQSHWLPVTGYFGPP